MVSRDALLTVSQGVHGNSRKVDACWGSLPIAMAFLLPFSLGILQPHHRPKRKASPRTGLSPGLTCWLLLPFTILPPSPPPPMHRPQSRVDLLAAADNAGPLLLLDAKKDKRAEKVRRCRVGRMAAHCPTLPVSVLVRLPPLVSAPPFFSLPSPCLPRTDVPSR